MILDIGCGLKHRGDINIDLKTPCDLICDIHYLPFRTNVFMKSYLNHVIEHVKYPVKALDEALRVSRFIEVTVPHAFHPYSHLDISHISFFTGSWFKKYAKSRNLKINGEIRFDRERTFYYFGVELCVNLVNKR